MIDLHDLAWPEYRSQFLIAEKPGKSAALIKTPSGVNQEDALKRRRTNVHVPLQIARCSLAAPTYS